MSTLHERLLAAVPVVTVGQGWPTAADVNRLHAAVRVVLGRHKPVPCSDGNCWAQSGHVLCGGCGSGRAWPTDCPDTMAISEALGVETEGDQQ